MLSGRYSQPWLPIIGRVRHSYTTLTRSLSLCLRRLGET
jgi:hypothetical protein